MALGVLKSLDPKKKRIFLVLLVVSLVGVLVSTVLAIYFGTKYYKDSKQSSTCESGKPFSSSSVLGKFSRAATSSSAAGCAEIGRDMLSRGGSAVDAAVAIDICIGVVNPHSSGLGGGFFMTYYNKKDGKAYGLISRERAPLLATQDMYTNDSTLSRKGGLSVAVPGELKGLWEAYQKFGKLSWSTLLEPSIQLCKNGVTINQSLFYAMTKVRKYIFNNERMRNMFFDPSTGDLKQVGDKFYQPDLAQTLERIKFGGADLLYNGDIGVKLVQDIQAAGGIISIQDFQSYRTEWVEPSKISIGGGLSVYTLPPPSSGLIMAYILSIVSNYEFNESSLKNDPALTYHRIAEAMKFSYAKRTELGDASFVNVTNLMSKLTSSEHARQEWLKINDSMTSQSPQDYGAHVEATEDGGTSQLSIISPEGDAVSLTSTINLYFGSGIMSQTGIVLNDEMDDFSTPGTANAFGYPASPSNFIVPQKIPMSSMSPSVFVDDNGEVQMVSGAAGGSRIISSTALVALRTLMFKEDLKTATDAARIHHQLIPMELKLEDKLSECTIEGLKSRGHVIKKVPDIRSVVCSVARNSDGYIHANSDYRKGGTVAGLS